MPAGDYTLTARAWDIPVQTNLFAIAADSGPTLISMDVPADGSAAFTTLGVPDVRYVVEASSNLADWSGLATNVGAPFDFVDLDAATWAQRFYRVSVGP